ncbi:hypothetical protein SK128_025759 [Halocaridina rubra]|uniref:Uncharacterized protein n=1 Tax=Halocaridina rubra TaxID=373956 RepID=A0AAN9A9W4_HALRR
MNEKLSSQAVAASAGVNIYERRGSPDRVNDTSVYIILMTWYLWQDIISSGSEDPHLPSDGASLKRNSLEKDSGQGRNVQEDLERELMVEFSPPNNCHILEVSSLCLLSLQWLRDEKHR